MPTPVTELGEYVAESHSARIRIDDAGTRKRFQLAGIPRSDATGGRERTNAMAKLALQLRQAGHAEQVVDTMVMAAKARPGRGWEAIVVGVNVLCQGGATPLAGEGVPTFGEHFEAWWSGELARKYPHHVKKKRSAETDRQRGAKHIPEELMAKPIDRWTLDDGELAMANIPEEASAGTRRQVAQIIRKVLALAVYPCRYRTENPIPRNWLPRAKSTKAKECLYPEEDSKLLGCADVPLLRRLAYGFMAREGMRRDELSRLEWTDLDLERGKVNLDRNKTDEPRDWDCDPGVVVALRTWRKRIFGDEPATGRVFAENGVPLNVDHLAETFRADLKRAGVTRPQLFERSPTRQPIRVHDLRSTFITLSLAMGRTETWVSDRTGHKSSAQIAAYRRKARTWAGLELGSLAPLWYALPEFREEPSPEAQRPAERPSKSSRRWRNWQTRWIQVPVG